MSERTTHHKIVVGTDGSSSALVAVQWAAREAAMRHVSLTVVHVASSLPVAASVLTWPAGHIPQEVLEIQDSEARAILAEAIRTAEDTMGGAVGIEIGSEQYLGSPVSALTTLSKTAQLVVVACRGRSGRHRRLLGSVGIGLLHHARGPVAIVHDEIQPAQLTELPVLVGIDCSPASEPATALAFDEASWRGVGLVALHVCSDTDVSSVPRRDGIGVHEPAGENLAETLQAWQDRYPEVPVTRVIERGHPARHLVDHAQQAQLVIVGSHGRGGFPGMLLGSVSTAVAQEAHVPALVARRQ
ncbi:universal stress protein [Mycolicibacterium mageritense]|uniref:universal stress protein n=1 Tax=Mycolicibacterium mageritense TaxID=53462 RepID=UPI001E35D53D|nr:universal stress protein [Mycolicibacterium mageritense]GJJ18069.1 universal stress protein UspA [Mycolicibacterium mageritense]